MAIEMVRKPSETPNIANIDDFVGLRYAYGNQNGYIIGKGQECSYTINGSKFKINSGRLVLQGIECDIDANGVEIIVDNVATKRYYTIYLQVNLATNDIKILSTFDTSTYPAIESGDNLTQNTTGVARMKLYNFDVTSGVISNVNKIVNKINYTEDILVNKAKQAINSIRHEDMSYTGFRDVGGVLKTGNEIISKKILVWEGSPFKETDGDLIVSGLNIGDKIEIEYDIKSKSSSSSFSSKIYYGILQYNDPSIIIQTPLYPVSTEEGYTQVFPYTTFSFFNVHVSETDNKMIFRRTQQTYGTYVYVKNLTSETMAGIELSVYDFVFKKIYKIVE